MGEGGWKIEGGRREEEGWKDRRMEGGRREG